MSLWKPIPVLRRKSQPDLQLLLLLHSRDKVKQSLHGCVTEIDRSPSPGYALGSIGVCHGKLRQLSDAPKIRLELFSASLGDGAGFGILCICVDCAV